MQRCELKQKKTLQIIDLQGFFLMLPDLDSNQDNQIQRLMYYHYTIGQ